MQKFNIIGLFLTATVSQNIFSIHCFIEIM